MFVAQVAVDPHRKGAAVLVPEPTGDGGDIHAAFNASSGKQVPQIVVSQAGDAVLPARVAQ